MYRRSWRDTKGLAASVLAVIVMLILIIAVVGVVVAWSYVNGDNQDVYIPEDDGTPIVGYLSAMVVVELDNRATFGALVIRFLPNSLNGELVGAPVGGAEIFKIFDIWSHDVQGYVKFRLTNPAFNDYDTGWQKATFSGNVGGTIDNYKALNVNWPNGPAIRHHGTYSLSAQLYTMDDKLWDTQTVNVDL